MDTLTKGKMPRVKCPSPREESGTEAGVNSETEKKDASLHADIFADFIFCRKMSILLSCFLTSQGKRETTQQMRVDTA